MSFPYKKNIEKSMKKFYDSLCEKNKRRYAAIESEKLSHGSVNYISALLECDPKTIRQGNKRTHRIRTGYNRNQTTWRRSKKKTSTPEYSGIDQDFLDILQQHTAGNPMNSSIRWTYLKPREIVSELLKKGYSVSRNIVRYLLKKHEYVKRKAQKNITMGGHPDRNAQFENITQLKQDYLDAGNPVIGAPCYLTKFRDSCRRNSFTYAANRRCSSRPASATD